jgi:hypothetical protein
MSTEFIEEMKEKAKEQEGKELIIKWGESDTQIREVIDDVFASHVIQIGGEGQGKTNSACGIHVANIESMEELAGVAEIWSQIFEELANEVRGEIDD